MKFDCYILHKLNIIYIHLFLKEYSDLDIWYRHVDQSSPSVISGISKAIDHLFTCHPNTATTFLSGIGLCQWEIQLWLFPISSTRQIGFIEDPIQCFTWVMAYWAFKQNWLYTVYLSNFDRHSCTIASYLQKVIHKSILCTLSIGPGAVVCTFAHSPDLCRTRWA